MSLSKGLKGRVVKALLTVRSIAASLIAEGHRIFQGLSAALSFSRMLLCQITARGIAAGVAVSPLPWQGVRSHPCPGMTGGVVRPGRQSRCSSRLSPALPRVFFCNHDTAMANASLEGVQCFALPKGMAQQYSQLPSHGKMENFVLKMFVLFPVVVCSLLLPCLWHQVESQTHEVTSFSWPAAAARSQPGMIWHLRVVPHSSQLG